MQTKIGLKLDDDGWHLDGNHTILDSIKTIISMCLANLHNFQISAS